MVGGLTSTEGKEKSFKGFSGAVLQIQLFLAQMQMCSLRQADRPSVLWSSSKIKCNLSYRFESSEQNRRPCVVLELDG